MKIERQSKCIYIVNGTKIDIRRNTSRGWKFSGARQAIFAYFVDRNPKMNWILIDKRVCHLMNKKDWSFWHALENGSAII